MNDTIIYYDVYGCNNEWIGMHDLEWLAEYEATKYGGYYIERREVI